MVGLACPLGSGAQIIEVQDEEGNPVPAAVIPNRRAQPG